MPGPTYSKRLAKKTKRAQRQAQSRRVKRRENQGYGKGGAFGGGRLSTKRRKQRSGKGSFKQVGTYKGSTRDAISGVSSRTRKQRSAASMRRAERIGRDRALFKGEAKPRRISPRTYEARYGVDTEANERKQYKRNRREVKLFERGKNLRVILNKPELTNRDVKKYSDKRSYKIRDKRITNTRNEIAQLNADIRFIKKNIPQGNRDEKIDWAEEGLFTDVKNRYKNIAKNATTNGALESLVAAKAAKQAELKRLMVRKSQGRQVRFGRRLEATPKSQRDKRERLTNKIDYWKRQEKTRTKRLPKFYEKVEQTNKRRDLVLISERANKEGIKFDNITARVFNEAIKNAQGKEKSELKSIWSMLKKGNHPNPELAIQIALQTLNKQAGQDPSQPWKGGVHPLVRKWAKQAQQFDSTVSAAESLGLGVGEIFAGSPASAALLATDLIFIGKGGLKLLGKLGVKFTGARLAANLAKSGAKATATSVKNIRKARLAKTRLADETTKVKGTTAREAKDAKPVVNTEGKTVRLKRTTKEKVAAAPKQVVEESVSGVVEAGKSGKYTGMSKDVRKAVEDYVDYEKLAAAKIAKNPRAAGGVNQKLNRLRQEIAVKLMDEPSLGRRGLAVSREALRPGVAFRSARSASRESANLATRYYYRNRPVVALSSLLAPSIAADLVFHKGTVTTNAYRNLRDYASGLLYGIGYTVAAGTDAIFKGDTDKVGALWEGIKETDVIALALQDRWSDALKSAEKRPIDALLSLSAVGAVVGRAARLGARAGGRVAGYKSRYDLDANRKAYQEALDGAKLPVTKLLLKGGYLARTVRMPDPLFIGSPRYINKRYSPNLFNSVVEQIADKREVANRKRLVDKADLAKKGEGPALTKSEERKLNRMERRWKALKEDAIYGEIDNLMARMELQRRAEIGDLDQRITDVANDLTKAVGPNAHMALRVVASGEHGGPTQALASIRRTLDEAIEYRSKLISEGKGGYNIHSQDEYIKTLRTVLENPDYLESDALWQAVGQLGDIMNPLEDELVTAGIILPQQRDFAPLVPYAVRQMGAKSFTAKNGIVRFYVDKKKGATGEMGEKEYLTAEDIRAHMKANGFDNDPVFFSAREAPDSRLGKDANAMNSIGTTYYSASTLGTRIREFNYDISFMDIKRQAIENKFNLTRSNAEKFIIENMVMGIDSEGRFAKTAQDANDAFINNPDNYDMEMVPFPIQTYGDNIRAGEDIVPDEIGIKGPVVNNLDEFLRADASNADIVGWLGNLSGKKSGEKVEALLKKGKATRGVEYGLIPRAAFNRLVEHNRADQFIQSSIGKIFTTMNREFKGAVLPLSVAWHTGNIVDMSMRAMFANVTPADIYFGLKLRKTLKKFPDVERAVLTELGGGHLMTTRNSLIRGRSRETRELETTGQVRLGLFSSRKLEPYEKASMNAAQKFLYNFPLLDKALARHYKSAQKAGYAVGSLVEETFRFSVAGKASRQMLEQFGSDLYGVMRLNAKAIDDVIYRFSDASDPRYLREVGDATNKVLGDYTNMSPGLKKAVRTIMPFGLWLRASATWIATLPVRHPVKVAFFAQVNSMTEKERREFGLSMYAPSDKQVPWYMMGAIPVEKLPKIELLGLNLFGDDTTYDPVYGEQQTNYIGTSKYTSFGTIFSIPSLLDFVLPYWKEPAFNIAGVDWTGKELKDSNGNKTTLDQNIGIALQGLMETFFYPASFFHDIMVGGERAPTSTIWKPERKFKFYGVYDSERVIWEEYSRRAALGNVAVKLSNPFKSISFTPDSRRKASSGGSLLAAGKGRTGEVGTEQRLNRAGLEWEFTSGRGKKKKKPSGGSSLYDLIPESRK